MEPVPPRGRSFFDDNISILEAQKAVANARLGKAYGTDHFTKTRLYKYNENFTTKKTKVFR